MTRDEAIEIVKSAFSAWESEFEVPNDDWSEEHEALDMAIEALSSDAISKAYNQGFVEGSVNATVNSNYICPRCGEIMERKESGDAE